MARGFARYIHIDAFLEDVRTMQDQENRAVVLRLRDAPLDRLAGIGESAFAHSIALYFQRLEDNGTLFSAFNSNILGTPGPDRTPMRT